MYISGVFGAPLEELQEKGGVGGQLQVFSGVGVSWSSTHLAPHDNEVAGVSGVELCQTRPE